MALENRVFSPFGPYSALNKAKFWPIGAESLMFGQISRLRLKISLICSNYAKKLCNTTPNS